MRKSQSPHLNHLVWRLHIEFVHSAKPTLVVNATTAAGTKMDWQSSAMSTLDRFNSSNMFFCVCALFHEHAATCLQHGFSFWLMACYFESHSLQFCNGILLTFLVSAFQFIDTGYRYDSVVCDRIKMKCKLEWVWVCWCDMASFNLHDALTTDFNITELSPDRWYVVRRKNSCAMTSAHRSDVLHFE